MSSDSNEITNLAIYESHDHFGIETMPTPADRLKWKHLIERCRLNGRQVRAIISEVAGEHDKLTGPQVFEQFSKAAFAYVAIRKEQAQEQTGKRDCAYCRGTGFAPIYNPKNPATTASVICLCDAGNQQHERISTSKNPIKMKFARLDSETRSAVMLFHAHETERLEQWQKERGLDMADAEEFRRKFKSRYLAKLPALFNPVPKLAKNAEVGGLPATVDEREMALAAYHNGDERGWE